ncbi:MAG: diaminopimelate epimerase [Candidatus Polarisedimenticolaceae bacterium]|nr:diaminopimelate epimerase [Candidatus Polarisedimenticolaceae bacterium]
MNFTKMHGLGNDFVVIDAINQSVTLSEADYRSIADRHFGIGCDQILLVEKARSEATDFYYRIINADGSEVEQCGNGARCFARFVQEKELSKKREIPVGTNAGDIRLLLQDDGLVQVDMGVPQLNPEEIPFIAVEQAVTYELEVDHLIVELSAVSIGNPHAVLRVQSVVTAPLGNMGPLLESHVRFPQRCNVGFMQVVDRQQIKLRVFERGAGETMACGTGACAAVVSGHLLGLLDERVKVTLPGGDLEIEWPGEGCPILMSGPAVTVFDGSIQL